MVIKMKMGICETTFARFDMADAAMDEIKGQVSNITFIRRTVPGVKDLPVASKKLIEEEVKEIVGKLATPHGGLIGVEYRYLQAIGATEESLRFAYECFKKYAFRS